MTANGTDISDGESLSGSQVVRVYGSNLTPPYFSLWFNGVEYTPLDYGDGYVEYILQDNGTYEIRNENDIVMSFDISGITIPSELPNRFQGYQYVAGGGNVHRIEKTNINCLNYPYKYDANYPYFRIAVGRDDKPFLDGDVANYECINCSIRTTPVIGSITTTLNFQLIDIDKVAYVKYKGFIFYVFNYPTTP